MAEIAGFLAQTCQTLAQDGLLPARRVNALVDIPAFLASISLILAQAGRFLARSVHILARVMGNLASPHISGQGQFSKRLPVS